jgi:superfamily I DNA/RNA helicase
VRKKGKTTRLLEILEEKLKTYSPREIAYVSFTREGAYQGKYRAMAKFNCADEDFPFFRTLHSLAFREMNANPNMMMNKKHYKMFSDQMGMKFTGYYTEELRNNDDRYLFYNQLHRNNPRIAQQYLYDLDIRLLEFVSKQYKTFRKDFHLLDFTDLIEVFNKNNQSIPVRIAIIDEAQDLTTLQWEMVWIAFRDCEEVIFAGDDDQAIYEWSGADVNAFLNLPAKMEILRTSYRLPEIIIEQAKKITALIENRVSKDYHGIDGKEGLFTRLAHIEELRGTLRTSNETWMFLSRNHWFLKEVEEFIRSLGLVYNKNGTPSVKKNHIKIINQFEQARKLRNVPPSIIPHLKEGFSFNTPWYDNLNWEEDEITYYRDLIKNKSDINKCNIRINTIHSVKGAEADNVVVLTDVTRQVHVNIRNNPDSEYRVLYVGCTRSKKRLFLVENYTRYAYERFYFI